MLEQFRKSENAKGSAEPPPSFRIPNVALPEESFTQSIADARRRAVDRAKELGRGSVSVAKAVNEFFREVEAKNDSPLDRLYSELNTDLHNTHLRYSRVWNEVSEFDHRDSQEYTGADEVWIVFPPWDTTVANSYNYNFIPKWGRSAVITLPGGFVNQYPEVTCSIFNRMLAQKDEYVAKILQEDPNQKISVISDSASNGCGIKTFNDLPKKNQGRLISAASGYGLGEEIFASKILEPYKRDIVDRGIVSGAEYNKAFSYEDEDGRQRSLLPYDNCESLGDDTIFAVAANDLYIPREFGERIAKKAQAANPNIRVITYPFGHIGTILYINHLEHLKHMKSVLRMTEEITHAQLSSFSDLLASRGFTLPEEAQDDLKYWCALAYILWGTEGDMKKTRLVMKDEQKRDIDQIARDFFRAILPESKYEFAKRLSMLSEQARGRLATLQ
ncbi:MAG: hypothetical protein NUV59_00610 [Patescibacteria group bacterium]|nr:hypothetical protein [Patescibacteria group bacterium]